MTPVLDTDSPLAHLRWDGGGTPVLLLMPLRPLLSALTSVQVFVPMPPDTRALGLLPAHVRAALAVPLCALGLPVVASVLGVCDQPTIADGQAVDRTAVHQRAARAQRRDSHLDGDRKSVV